MQELSRFVSVNWVRNIRQLIQQYLGAFYLVSLPRAFSCTWRVQQALNAFLLRTEREKEIAQSLTVSDFESDLSCGETCSVDSEMEPANIDAC